MKATIDERVNFIRTHDMEADPTLPVRESRAAESQENKRKNTKAKVQVQAQPTTITVALAALLLFRDDSNNIF